MMKQLCVVVFVLLLPAAAMIPSASLPCRRYNSIFTFGNSFADTGNDIVVFTEHSLPKPAARPPYGMTFFGHPTGRNSNGRLILDFVAEKLGLPFVPPFLAHNGGSFRQGANFAVAGATALNASFFRDIPGVGSFVLNTSSSVQLGWFDLLKSSLCSLLTPCVRRVRGLLPQFSLFHGRIRRQRLQLLFLRKDPAGSEIDGSIRGESHQAGIPPLGCMPAMLAIFPSADPADYEPGTGCLKRFNQIAVYHNALLQDALVNVRINHPDVRVVYADFFTPVIRIVESPATFGFTSDILRCCCGGGGKYNFNTSAGCGMAGSTVCDYPATYLFWDGHMTEAAYRIIANAWLNSINTS